MQRTYGNNNEGSDDGCGRTNEPSKDMLRWMDDANTVAGFIFPFSNNPDSIPKNGRTRELFSPLFCRKAPLTISSGTTMMRLR
jgi:hypothetical protein